MCYFKNVVIPAAIPAATYSFYRKARIKQYLQHLQSLGTLILYILVRQMSETRGFQGLWYPVAVHQGWAQSQPAQPRWRTRAACRSSRLPSTPQIISLFQSETGVAPVPTSLSWLRNCKMCSGSEEQSRGSSKDVGLRRGTAGLEAADLLHM